MKHILLALMISSLGITSAFAGDSEATAGVNSRISADTRAAAGAIAGSNAGNAQSVNFYGPSDAAAKASADAQVQAAHELANGTATLKTAPPVYAPNIITSNDTCMGSSSIGASGVGFGVSFGTSWTDANCIMLKNAREMYNMGMPDVAFARLCMDDLNREAIELTGKVCPQTIREEKAKADAQKQATAQ